MADEKPAATYDRDLFGAPVDQMRDRWGRPSFKKTAENQLLVSTLKAAGWSQERVARFLGCDTKTLRKYFSRELAAGSDLVEGQALQVLVAKMRQGNMAAVRKVLDMTAAGAAQVPDRPAAPVEDEDAPEKLGKKETLEREARTPTGGWGSLLN